MSSRPSLAPSLALAVVGGVLYFLGFPGFDVAPCAFVALVPLVLLLERESGSSFRRRGALAFLYGVVEFFGGYYWMNPFLEEFSGFPTAVTLGITVLFCGYLALFQVAFAFLYGQARARGHAVTPIVVLGTCALETTFPMIFPSYLGNALHVVPWLAQIADVGGPLLVSAFVATVNGGLAELALHRTMGQPLGGPRLAVIAALVLANVAYGAYRIHEVEARMARAPTLSVAMVQVNMGTFSKREDPYEGHQRHLAQSRAIERQAVPDLFVWPESAYTFYAPRDERLASIVLPGIAAPVLFGGLSRRVVDGRSRPLNTAFLVDAQDRVVGRYDKHYLVPFGETIPFGDVFPSLYELSPNTGNFATGTSTEALVLGDARMSVFVCYEDLLPGFVRELVRDGNPNLLVNLTNDAWYGDTHEPWIHLALAKFRAIEHHRSLVRSTNSGVSAFIDPLGRVVSHTGVFTREELVHDVPMLEGHTVFEWVGPTPFGLAAVFGMAWLAFGRRRRDGGTLSGDARADSAG